MATDPNFLTELGPFPILQLLGGILVLTVGGFVWLRGSRQPPPMSEALLRIDGPIARVIELLSTTATYAKANSENLQSIAEEARNCRRLLEQTRDAIEHQTHR